MNVKDSIVFLSYYVISTVEAKENVDVKRFSILCWGLGSGGGVWAKSPLGLLRYPMSS